MKIMPSTMNRYVHRDVSATKLWNAAEKIAARDDHRFGRHPIVVTDWRFLRTYRGDTHAVGRFSTTRKLWATPPLVRVYVRQRVAVARGGPLFVILAEPGEPDAGQLLVSQFAAFDEKLRGGIEDITQSVCVSFDVAKELHPFYAILELDVASDGVKRA
ncbi:hypothetical protein [Cupriavidus sp. BIS7]|uniref:hypothetical protein n=1 Tax=Cupriavidus sp. BIS7 TaxID=1217718 RepID=UPI000362FCFD|nr:hypothetical protein [Cupriavidus sp. BIS7]